LTITLDSPWVFISALPTQSRPQSLPNLTVISTPHTLHFKRAMAARLCMSYNQPWAMDLLASPLNRDHWTLKCNSGEVIGEVEFNGDQPHIHLLYECNSVLKRNWIYLGNSELPQMTSLRAELCSPANPRFLFVSRFAHLHTQ